MFTLTGSTSRTWNLLVSQLECGSLSLPPTGCLQYHTGSTGTVRSFNWQDSDTSLIHLQSQFYSVCIRKELGYCKIGWKQVQHIALALIGFRMPELKFQIF